MSAIPGSPTLASRSVAMGARRRAAPMRIVGAGVVLGVLLWRLGAGPVADGIRTLDGWTLGAAALLALVTTVCSAVRWRLVAAALDVPIGLRSAVAACYRAQFLNVTLPGGVVGDVHRGVHHGRGAGHVARGLRAVAWERTAGQAVQLSLAALVLLLPSPLGAPVRALAAVALAALAVTALAASRTVGQDPGRPPSEVGRPRWSSVVTGDLRALLAVGRGRGRAALVIGLSTAVVAGHVATFALAARATGASLNLVEVVPVALVVLVGSGLPLNVAGWGPREGVAAWAFAASGWGAAQGLATAVAYGVMVFVASLPGAAVLAREGVRHE